MNYMYDPKEMNGVTTARESYSGRLLTDPQFEEAMAITGIIERDIRRTCKFKDKLGDYAHAWARSEKFDAQKADTIIRDLFKERTGQTMNQMRESLLDREDNLTPEQINSAYQYATEVGVMIEQGNKMSFNRASSHQAQMLADELQISDVGAKSLMKETFAEKQGRDFYEWGKEVEEKYYKPQIEAERKERDAKRDQEKSETRTRTRTRSRRRA